MKPLAIILPPMLSATALAGTTTGYADDYGVPWPYQSPTAPDEPGGSVWLNVAPAGYSLSDLPCDAHEYGYRLTFSEDVVPVATHSWSSLKGWYD